MSDEPHAPPAAEEQGRPQQHETPDPSTSVTENAAAADPGVAGPTAALPYHPQQHTLLPGPFVAPSSYLRPLSTSSRRGEMSTSGEGSGMAASNKRRKASNPVEREQIEGLVSLVLFFLFPFLRTAWAGFVVGG